MRTVHTNRVLDVVSLIGPQLGYHPRDSLAIMMMMPQPGEGATTAWRSGTLARIDIAAAVAHTAPAQLADALARIAPVGSTALLVAYTDDDDDAHAAFDNARSAADLVAAVTRTLSWHVSTTTAQCVGPCPDGPCSVPLEDLRSTPVVLEAVAHGVHVAPTRAQLAVAPASAAARRRAGAAARTWQRSTAGRSPAEQLGTASELWARALDEPAEERDADDLGRLAASITHSTLRDAALIAVIAHLCGEPAPSQQHPDDVAASSADHLAKVLSPDPGVSRRPSTEQTATVLDLLYAVAGHAPREMAVAPVSMAALVAWWAGDGTRAAVLVDQAHDLDATYRLALLLGHALEAGMPPGWFTAAGRD